jgi:hypothetical protein
MTVIVKGSITVIPMKRLEAQVQFVYVFTGNSVGTN